MGKKEISYIELVKVMMAKARKDAAAAGSGIDTKAAFGAAAARWKIVKDGSDSEYSQGKTVPGAKRTSKKTKKEKKSGSDSSTQSIDESSGDANKIVSDILTKLDLCDDCKTKIKEYVSKTPKKNKTQRRTRKIKKRR